MSVPDSSDADLDDVDGRTYQVALLDVTLDADPATSRLLAAYRRWSAD